MILLGTIINSVLIIIGSIIGRLFQNIPEKMKDTVLQIIGLAVAVLGIQMGFETSNVVIVIVSLVIGAVLGEWLDLEHQINKLGKWVESLFKNRDSKVNSNSSISDAFVTATLLFVIGSMGIIGALDSGLRNNHDVLITKGIIDGFIAIILSSTLGLGVLLSAVPILLYEGAIALLAGLISIYIPEAALNLYIQEMTATGGIMILAIGLNMTGLTKIRVANLLPGIVVVGIVVAIIFPFQ
ncbi:DUF554 domain-containing protein [Ureibacillus acetophenoni]|uniref:DUF554 domain-containing protein n=1 Tax=Ureibacillus acetophenoni TaxID=614649 RepID=A0A285UBV1_9BACL|nr:DUF554 domain-containing protein [Ureibacillus acetophenoni]SOC39394.1 hypothetical protein SAMN05877842_105198 [Ureibacillus acetophenoni]